VVLRTTAAFQTAVSGQEVRVQNADGSAAPVFGRFAGNLPNPDRGVAMLIATADAQELFGIAADQLASGTLASPAGRICFSGSNDCVAYGDFTGDNTGFGSPAAAPGPGQALVRIANDHDNSTDFAAGPALPENNAGTTGSSEGRTCRVDAGTPTPTVTPTPTATPEALPTCTDNPPGVSCCIAGTGGEMCVVGTAGGSCPEPPLPACPAGCAGDCNANGMVTVDELVRGVNIGLGVQPVSTCPAMDFNGNAAVTVDELVKAVSNALGGCPQAAGG